MNYDKLVCFVNEILKQYTMKLTLRQLYYRLVSKNLIPNTKSSYKGLSSQLVKARENGDVDGSRIEDRSRKVQGYADHGYDNIDDFISSLISNFKDSWSSYSKPMWADQPNKVMVALEKDALSRLFLDVANGFRVQVYATRGYGSYTFVKDMAGDLYTGDDKENVILYFGDYDPSGRDIERDLKDRLVRYYGRTNFTVIRIALTPEQIQQYNLPPMPEDAATLKKLSRDTRTKIYGLEYAVELDAIEPSVLQGLIRRAIVSKIDEEKWTAQKEKIDEETKELQEKFEGLRVFFGDEEFEEE
jgi:hypothetical protein